MAHPRKGGWTVEEIRDMVEVQDMSHGQVAELYGCCQQAISRTCKKHQILCRGFHGRSGRHSAGWRGGRSLNENGYWMVHCPDHPHKHHGNYVYEHRLVMEKHLGRHLAPEEVVHHKNHDKQDNRIENL